MIVALNGKLVLDQIGLVVSYTSGLTARFGPFPVSWLVAGLLYGVTGGAALLLSWVTVKPIWRSSPAWLPKPSVKLDWVKALRPRRLERIGVALEHDQADAEILNRALGLVQTDGGQSELVLLHVVDTPITRVLGSETADREAEADERYLADLVAALRDRGYKVRPVLLHGPNPAGELVSHLRKDPVDLLVVGSHGHGMVRDLLLGQTVDRVRHSLGVPMLIARPDRVNATARGRLRGVPTPFIGCALALHCNWPCHVSLSRELTLGPGQPYNDNVEGESGLLRTYRTSRVRVVSTRWPSRITSGSAWRST